jgi:hypothetical protein
VVACCYAKAAVTVDKQQPNVLVRRDRGFAHRGAQTLELPRVGVATDHTAAGRSDPQHPRPILRQRGDPIVRQAARLHSIVDVAMNFVAVVAIQSVLGPEPEESLRILENRHHRAL